MRMPLLSLLSFSLVLAIAAPLHAQGLKPSDQQGAQGTGQEAADLTTVVNQRLMLTRNQEAAQEKSLQQLLDQMVGPGKALVRVKLDLDFNQRTVRNQLKAPVTENGKPVMSDRSVGSKGQQETMAFNVEDSTVLVSPGNIKRLSVTVVLPGDVRPENVQKIRQIVATATGADAARRDQVTVESYAMKGVGTTSGTEK